MVPWDFERGKAGDPFPDWRTFSNGSQANVVPSLKTHALLPPPRDIEEHYERSATFWVAFSIDRHTSASTGALSCCAICRAASDSRCKQTGRLRSTSVSITTNVHASRIF